MLKNLQIHFNNMREFSSGVFPKKKKIGRLPDKTYGVFYDKVKMPKKKISTDLLLEDLAIF